MRSLRHVFFVYKLWISPLPVCGHLVSTTSEGCPYTSSSDLMSLWMHLSISIVSCETILFHSSSDSLLTHLGRGMSASLCMVFLCFSCSVFGSGLLFQQVCFLTGLLSNCSIALFIISWNSLMNSILSIL